MRGVCAATVLLMFASGCNLIEDYALGLAGPDSGPDDGFKPTDVRPPDGGLGFPDGGELGQPDPELLHRSNNALAEWNIGLATGTLAGSRNTDPGAIHNPPNWITASGPDCIANGVPDSLRDDCVFDTPGVIGVCEFRIYPNGNIADTTQLMLLDYQRNDDKSDANKQAVFTHETGHCLGLKHTDSQARIMFASTAGADSPHASELGAVAEVYAFGEPHAPSTSTWADFYLGSAEPVFHGERPTFYIDSAMGRDDVTLLGEAPVRGPDAEGLTRFRTLYFEDGSGLIQRF